MGIPLFHFLYEREKNNIEEKELRILFLAAAQIRRSLVRVKIDP